MVNGKYQGVRRKEWKQVIVPSKRKKDEEASAVGEHHISIMEGYNGYYL